jgi:plastocyanin
MLTWLMRALLALGVVVLGALALGSRTPDSTPAPTLTPVLEVAAPVVAASPLPTSRPTATAAKFVERIISRVARDTPAPYPTSTPLPDGLVLVNVVDFGYMPSVTRIHVGQTVVWQNGGRELHDVTGEDDWHSGPIEGRSEYRHVFGFEGSFNYRCSVHPDMRGTVIVQP